MKTRMAKRKNGQGGAVPRETESKTLFHFPPNDYVRRMKGKRGRRNAKICSFSNEE